MIDGKIGTFCRQRKHEAISAAAAAMRRAKAGAAAVAMRAVEPVAIAARIDRAGMGMVKAIAMAAALALAAGCAGRAPFTAGTEHLYEETEPPDGAGLLFAEFEQLNEAPYILTGTLLLPGGEHADGGLLVEDGIIQAVWQGEMPDTVGEELALDVGEVTRIDTRGIVMPGLIDLHNHVAYNFLPFWDAGRTWSNRYEWARASAYRRAVSEPYGAAKRGAGLVDEMNKYGEIRALVGGTTSILGAAPSQGSGILARNIDQRTLGVDTVRTSVGTVYEFGCARGRPRCPEQQQAVTRLKQQLDDGMAIVFHLAEGIDAASRDEFDWLEETGLVRDGVVLTHATALGTPEFRAMADAGVGLVWSPRSNVELYGRTTEIDKAKRAGVRIALAPDWSPSGSDNLLAELRYAEALDRDSLGGLFDARELVLMATEAPADLAGRGDVLGRLAPTFAADLLVLEQVDPDPYESVVQSDERHVRLVTVNGVPLYGWRSFLRRLGKDGDFETLTVRGRVRALDANVPADAGVRNGTQRYTTIRDRLAESYAPFGELPGLYANDP